MIRRIPSASVQTITVTDARALLPHILAGLKTSGVDAVPILIGRHREPMAVLISVEQFYEYCAFVSTQLAEYGDEEELAEHGDSGRPPRIIA